VSVVIAMSALAGTPDDLAGYYLGYYVGAPLFLVILGLVLGYVFRKKTTDGKVFNKMLFRIFLGLAVAMVAVSIIKGP